MAVRPPLLLTGGTGLIGCYLRERSFDDYRTRVVVHRHHPGPLRRGDRVIRQDLTAAGGPERVVEASDPEVVVHCAAMAALGACESDPDRARHMNVEVTRQLARAASERGAYFVLFSTDQVFDGESAPYTEADPTAPVSEYGRTKEAAEQVAQENCPDALILRCALVLGRAPPGAGGALDMLRPGSAPTEVSLFEDEWRTPITAPCIARCMEGILRDRPSGLLHLAGPDRLDRLTLGRRVVEAFGFDGVTLVPGSRKAMAYPRPADVSLDTTRLQATSLPQPRPLAEALRELAAAESR